jgi:hypothetical protein
MRRKCAALRTLDDVFPVEVEGYIVWTDLQVQTQELMEKLPDLLVRVEPVMTEELISSLAPSSISICCNRERPPKLCLRTRLVPCPDHLFEEVA